MEENLLVGDRLFVSKFTYGYSKHSLPFSPNISDKRIFYSSPERGDVIVFNWPKDTTQRFIKRVIGLPGDTVDIASGQVKIIENGKTVVLDEKYLPGDTLTLAEGTQAGAFSEKIDPNEYFVMGDNRQHSSDSREWGLLPKANIIGRSWLTILPASKFGIQKRVNYQELSQLLSHVFARN